MPHVVIKTRDLDTDAKAFEVVEVDRVPDNPLRQEQHLEEVVKALHPDVRHRSFAEGVSSFVAPQHLVVAYYKEQRQAGPGKENPRPSDGDDAAEQDQLFAA